MRLFEAVPQIIKDLKDECEIVTSKRHPVFEVTAARHPTLGKVVIIESSNGDGIIVETEE